MLVTMAGACDYICAICKDLLIEPVKLPCMHYFCLVCICDSCDITSYSCPLCKKRNSVWWRRNTDKKSLIDTTLWDKIKRLYPDEVAKKNSGEYGIPDFDAVYHNISSPGELGKELEIQRQEFMRLEEERKKNEEMLSKQAVRNFLKEQELSYVTERITRRRSQQRNVPLKGPIEAFVNRSDSNTQTSSEDDIATKRLIKEIRNEQKLPSVLTPKPKKRRQSRDVTVKKGPMDKHIVHENLDDSRFRPIATCPTSPTKTFDSKPAIAPLHNILKVNLERISPFVSENSAFEEIKTKITW